MFKRTGYRVEQAILLAIILLNILDFFELLDPFWDYVKKIISWTLIGYLIYRASPMRMLVGERLKHLDLAYVLAAFAINSNDIVGYAAIARENMIAHAAQYLAFLKDVAVQNATIVVNISEEAWNSLTYLGLVPNATDHLLANAEAITLAHPSAPILFQHGADAIGYSIVPQGLNGALLQVYNSIVPLMSPFEQWGLIVGLAVFVLLAAWVTFRHPVRKPSFLALVDKEGEPHGLAGVLVRFSVMLLAFIFFLLFIFNLIGEWLAIAIDAPLLMIGLAFSFMILFTHRHEKGAANWIHEVSGFGIGFYERFIGLFHNRKHVLLGVSGLLVLHALTEIGNFLLPYALPMRDQLYLSRLGAGHDNLFILALQQFGNPLQGVSAILVALAVLVAWFLLLGLPGYIWYKIFRLRHDGDDHLPSLSPWLLGVCYGTFVVAVLVPVIWVRPLSIQGLIGVDFFTQPFTVAYVPLPAALLAGIAVFALVFGLAQARALKPYLMLPPFLASLLFLGLYAFLFFTSSFTYYLGVALAGFQNAQPAVGVGFFLFLVLSVVFYVSSYFLFLYEIFRD